MKYYLSLALAFVSVNSALAQVDYDVAKIPENLKKDAIVDRKSVV